MEKIEIQYLPSVSEEIIIELKESYSVFTEVSLHKKPRPQWRNSIENFDSKTITDIIVYFHDNYKEFVNAGIHDIGVAVLKKAYRTLTQSRRKEFNGKSSSLIIIAEYSDVKVELKIEGELTDNQIGACFDNLDKLISSGKIKSDYNNPDYHSGGELKKMHRIEPLPHQFDSLQYGCDVKSGLWTPRDFAAEARGPQKTIEELGDRNLF